MATSNVASNGYIVDCVKEIESLGLNEYGFNLISTHYGDEEAWENFQKVYHTELKKGVDSAPAECAAAMKELDDKLVTRIHNDAQYSDKSPEEVSAAFQIFCLDEEESDEEEEEAMAEDEESDEDGDGPWAHEMGPGFIRSMCLMADEDCMKSVTATPYVLAVDALLHAGADLGYKGYFKVAIDSLMPKFYAAIGHFDLDKVAKSVDDDGIWRGMKGE
ncbi:hypothetical protein NLG97_g9865 [Lecanicillium saksenae]|uniref:Uncharacterized protein n=1 Tax=Lecanicillium saksenae TaxID=468837 RepID=A0ACC1QH99_9HYPO|nr:hypothetical protein NLG97_g9865 [Lecanicillium saksenae]